uniref:PSI domain-containing protein n=1 Tax=Globisporangium ultimum (strain ATCC 200006 / CBS 805.95 / DAOM BR144) TaxID=431595 RepID=K3WID0_GLOUD
MPHTARSALSAPRERAVDDVSYEQLDATNATWTACAEYKTCDACVNASYACHFCEFDFQCHAIGSPLGCVTGISTCHHLDDCKRPEPQYIGYGPPPSVVIAVLCLIVTLTCCICGIASICSVFLRCRKSRVNARASPIGARNKKKNTTLINKDDEELAQSQEQPLLAGTHEHEIMSFEDDVDNVALERLSARRERERPFTWRSFMIRIVSLASLIGITVLALMFYPRMPDYNVCNREFDWESILQSLRSLHPKIEYQVLISAINENRFGFMLEEGKADIYHNGTLVGYWKLDAPLEAKAGSITDVIAPIKIEPDYSEAYSLWSDFRNNELIFRINATISGSITWGKHKIYRISTSVDDIEFLVGAEYDRGLCKCTEYLTPQ